MRVAVVIAGVVASAFLLSGCAAIPPIVSIAAWGLDGVVFVATDKTITDHAISTIAQKDCAILRGLMGKKVCRNYPPGTEPPIRVAAADLSPPPSRRGGQVVPPRPGKAPEVLIAAAPAPATASGSSPAHASGTAKSDERPTLKVQRILVRLEQAKKARRAAPSDLERAVARLDVGGHGPAPRPAIALSPLAPPAAPLAPVEARPTLVSMSAAPAPRFEELQYVVLGSFADPANAARRVEEQAELWPFTAIAVVKGHRYRRVLAGPYPAAQAKEVLHRLKAQGVSGAWTLRLAAPAAPRLANVLGLGASAANDGT